MLIIVYKVNNNYRSILIETLLRYYININISNKQKKTILISKYLINANIKKLIIYNTTINIVNFNKKSALYLAFK